MLGPGRMHSHKQIEPTKAQSRPQVRAGRTRTTGLHKHLWSSPGLSPDGLFDPGLFWALSSPCDGLEDLLLCHASLLLAEINSELQCVASLAFLHVGPHCRPSQLFRCGNAVVAVGQEQDAVNIEHHHGCDLIEVVDVIRNPLRV